MVKEHGGSRIGGSQWVGVSLTADDSEIPPPSSLLCLGCNDGRGVSLVLEQGDQQIHQLSHPTVPGGEFGWGGTSVKE